MNIEVLEAYRHIEEVKLLFTEYTSSLGVDLSYQNYAGEFAALPGKYAPPSGRLYVAYCDGMAAGCIALRSIDEATCEMKRLYVRERFRGLHIGRMLAERIILDAKAIGYRSMVLDTLSSMNSAKRLYAELGFREIAPYYDSPVQGTCFLSLSL
ncbi:MAG TPA: GNAT family N-acetyltransferase [Clostridia bacterium]|nr:GNAT family N-acetyltransferase [Clostridia bacterium]